MLVETPTERISIVVAPGRDADTKSAEKSVPQPISIETATHSRYPAGRIERARSRSSQFFFFRQVVVPEETPTVDSAPHPFGAVYASPAALAMAQRLRKRRGRGKPPPDPAVTMFTRSQAQVSTSYLFLFPYPTCPNTLRYFSVCL